MQEGILNPSCNAIMISIMLVVKAMHSLPNPSLVYHFACRIVKIIDNVQFFTLPESDRLLPPGYPSRRRTPEDMAANNGGMRLT